MAYRQVFPQALDPYIDQLWRALLREPDMMRYFDAKHQGSIDAALYPPRPHLVQISQDTYTAQTWTFSHDNTPPPITFFVDGRKGIRMSDAYNKSFTGLFEAEQAVGPLSHSEKATYRINLPGLNPFVKHSPARRATVDKEPLSRQTIAHHVAKVVKACIEQHGGHWWDANAGQVRFDELYLLELRRVSEGSCQPVLAVYRY